MIEDVRFSGHPHFEKPSLVVGWTRDAGKLSPQVLDYLTRKIKAESFCEVEPTGFFSLAGVSIENDIAQFPEGRFYHSEKGDLVIFTGSEPQFDRHRFLNVLLDVAEHYCRVQEVFTINGTISSTPHTGSRRVLAVFNQSEIQEKLGGLGLQDMDWQGPPAVSSHLLWIARSRGIPGVSLWTEIPFYLAAGEDFQAVQMTLSFLNKRFNLELDLTEFDDQITEQNARIAQLRQDDPKVDDYIRTLESGLSLNEAEQMDLVRGITEILETGG